MSIVCIACIPLGKEPSPEACVLLHVETHPCLGQPSPLPSARLCGDRVQAFIALVACETERTMTWSRLQGLICHWAVSKAQGAEWQLPPRGFTTVPDSTTDAGGAWQSKFEVHPLVGPEVTNEKMFTLAMSLPLEGSLENGGMVFVLKSGISGANTKWLKDAKTGKDIFLDLQALKTVS
jgi:hypothetical protein